MKNSLGYILLIVAILLILTGCEDSEIDKANIYSKEQSNDIEFLEIIPELVSSKIRVTGVLEGINDVEMTSEVNGKIIHLYKKLGDKVVKGERVASIDNRDIVLKISQAEAAVKAAKAELDSREIIANSNNRLFTLNAISEKECKLSIAQYDAAKAQYEGAKADLETTRMELERSNFTAPFNGIVVSMNIEIGDFVSVGSRICSIVNNSRMKVTTGIPESQISQVEVGKELILVAKSDKSEFTGKISGIGFKPNEDKMNYPVEIIIDKPGRLFSGQVVEGFIDSRQFDNMIIVPVRFIASMYSREYVFVINKYGIVEKREIKKGRKFQNRIRITSGLEFGDVVVFSPSGKVKTGMSLEYNRKNDVDSYTKEVSCH